MNNIDKLVKELEEDAVQAEVQYDYSIRYSKHYDAYYFNGYKKACIAHIAKLQLLLKEETAKDLPVRCTQCGYMRIVNEDRKLMD